MLSQQLIMTANAEAFKVNPKYYEAIPRPTYDERRALEESLLVNGQLYPVAVNKNMVVLDGHTRFEILQSRGKPIKYQVFEFESEEDEYMFVVESNIMKRSLSSFQKIETMYNFIKAEKEKKLMINYDTRVDIINAIKNGHVMAHDIAREIGMSKMSTNRVLVTMVEEFYLGRDKNKMDKRWKYEYRILPKSEELLVQGVRKRKVTISRLIGVSTTTLQYGLYLIENAPFEMLTELRKGTLKITEAYTSLVNRNIDGKARQRQLQLSKTLLKCPECNHIGDRNTFKKLSSKTPPQYR